MQNNSSNQHFNTAVGDIVSVSLDSSNCHSIGVNFLPDVKGLGAVVGSWDRAYGANFGVVQKHGGVHVGDCLFAVNDNLVGSLAHLEVLSILNDRNIMKTSLVFMSQKEYSRRK